MSALVRGVAVLFVLVSLLTWARWLPSAEPVNTRLDDPSVKNAEQQRAVSPSMERRGDKARDDAGQGRSVPLGERAAPLEPEAEPQPDTAISPVEEKLVLGLAMGFTYSEALALVRTVELEALEAFFSARTHITPEWLHRSGLPAEHLRGLYARWASGSSVGEREGAPGSILLSRHSPRHDGGPYRAQSRFMAEDRTVYLHYSVPDTYTGGSVVIRWVHETAEGLSHFDFHNLTADPTQRQEAWARPKQGWQPGTYRVEIYGAEAAMPLLATRSYNVLP